MDRGTWFPFAGKDATSVVCKFDAAVEAAIRDALRHAAIEEGQWTEKRDINAAADLATQVAKVNRGRDRLAAAKKEALARGEKW